MAKSLKKKGVLIIDYLNVPVAEKQLVPSVTKKFVDVHFEISRWQDNTHFYKKIDVHDSNNNFHHSYTRKVRTFSDVDFIEMLSGQMMHLEAIFDDYFLAPYDLSNTLRMILIAK
ncbi:MAG: hypothetical protein ABIY35_06105 [Chitinophagaceae bacterium]